MLLPFLPSQNQHPHPPIPKQRTLSATTQRKMCQEYHQRYACVHTLCVGVKQLCSHASWPPAFHQKIIIIVGQPFPVLCLKCTAEEAKKKRVLVKLQPTIPAYTIPVAISTVPVATAPAYIQTAPALQTFVVPRAAQIVSLTPAPAPTLPQQTPGPGSGGAPLPIPQAAPGKMIIKTKKMEFMKSQGKMVEVDCYQEVPAPVNPATGYNTIHGSDPGPPPPGMGKAPTPYPAGRTGYSTTHGADPGPPPPGSKSYFPVIPSPFREIVVFSNYVPCV